MPKSRLRLKDSNLKWRTSNSLQYDTALPRRSKTTFYSLQPHYLQLCRCVARTIIHWRTKSQGTALQDCRTGHYGQEARPVIVLSVNFQSFQFFSVITLLAKLSDAVNCNRSCLFVCVCVFVCGSVTTITRNCVHRSSPNWVCRWR